MTDSAAILELRHARVAEQATLSPAQLRRESTDNSAGNSAGNPDGNPAGDPTDARANDEVGVFVAIDEPPPVRTVLAVVQGDERRALEVTSVVEVAERDEHGTRGFYGRWVDEEALGRAGQVGTEHLDDGTPVVQPVMPEHSVQMNVSDAPGMAMPAPVLIVEDDTGVINVGNNASGSSDSEDADAEAASPEEAAAASESAPMIEGQSAEGDADTTEAQADATEGDADTTEAQADAAEDQADQADAAEDQAGATEDEADAAEGQADAAEGQANAEDGARQSSTGRRSRGRKKRKRR
ncbi:MAG: hypothetical protein AAGF11_18180 [Myxococcota bacterium]